MFYTLPTFCLPFSPQTDLLSNSLFILSNLYWHFPLTKSLLFVTRTTKCDISDTCNSSTAHILLYKFILGVFYRWGRVGIDRIPWCPTFIRRIAYRSSNMPRNLWIRQCLSFSWPCVWLENTVYAIELCCHALRARVYFSLSYIDIMLYRGDMGTCLRASAAK